ncbi:MAG: DnaD domain protein [Firmicutes bacterium]|nr:DnaD domain protein [Bacillota bacterium]
MAVITYAKNGSMGFTPISNKFIDEYMPYANPAFVTVYILTLKNFMADVPIDTQFLAGKLGLLESDVINAWKYWQSKGIMNVMKSGDSYEIGFENDISENVGEESKKKKISISDKPIYDTETIAALSGNELVKSIFSYAEKIFSSHLTFNDMSVLAGLYDWLKLSPDVIFVLLKYCADKGKKIRYVEKVAIDWAEKEITSVELAEEYINLFDGEYTNILKSMGITNRQPTAKEKEIMNRWVMEYKMPMEIITEACERGVMNTGKANLKYADKILVSWHEKNVKTLDDVKKLDEEYSEKEDKKKTVPEKQTKSKFVNYEQRGYDYDKLAQLEEELLKSELEED